jgi:hypothetical protein
LGEEREECVWEFVQVEVEVRGWWTRTRTRARTRARRMSAAGDELVCFIAESLPGWWFVGWCVGEDG